MNETTIKPLKLAPKKAKVVSLAGNIIALILSDVKGISLLIISRK